MSNDDDWYSPAIAHLAPPRKTRVEALAELADVVRKTIACPRKEDFFAQ